MPDKVEINFSSEDCIETLDTRLGCIQEKLRVIHNPYQGNKRKLICDIFSTIDKHGIKYDSFLDLFSGSSVVSLAAKMLGKKVFSNDAMIFAYMNAHALVENNVVVLSDEDKKYLFTNKNNNTATFVRDNYSGSRFTLEEADFLDNYYANVRSRFKEGSFVYSVAIISILHYIIESCFVGGRLNNGQVLASLQHRLDHVRNGGNAMTFSPQSINWVDAVFPSSQACHAFNYDALRLLRSDKLGQIDLCYIDPPYGSNQSDYAKMYAFFEEYIYQKPLEELPHITNMRKFVSKKEYNAHFSELLDNLRHIPVLVLSYNNSSWAKIADIITLIKRFRNRVSVTEIDYSYNYREKEEVSKEYIIISE